MKLFRIIPLFFILFVAFNIVFLTSLKDILNTLSFSLPIVSGAVLQVNFSHGLIFLGLICLFIEMIKATSSKETVMLDHVLSLFVFLAYLIEFLIVPFAGTATYALLMIMAFMDVVVGIIFSIKGAPRLWHFQKSQE